MTALFIALCHCSPISKYLSDNFTETLRKSSVTLEGLEKNKKAVLIDVKVNISESSL